MKLEIGKYYKAEDGEKVGPMIYHDNEWVESDMDEQGRLWMIDGGTRYHRNTGNDLIAEWTDTPEVGTLAEIGAKVGDVVEFKSGHKYIIASTEKVADGLWEANRVGSSKAGETVTIDPDDHGFRITSRASDTGPVRTVTRTTREIVPGWHDDLYVGNMLDDRISLSFKSADSLVYLRAHEIKRVAAHLTAIADTLESLET